MPIYYFSLPDLCDDAVSHQRRTLSQSASGRFPLQDEMDLAKAIVQD